jgi:hypothetical protein
VGGFFVPRPKDAGAPQGLRGGSLGAILAVLCVDCRVAIR